MVFLFDVDGTLLKTGLPHHNKSLRVAVEQVCGRYPDLDTIPLSGRTDTEILRDMIASIGGDPSPRALRESFQAAIDDFARRCPADISEAVIPGVRPTLERLKAAGGAIGLVTGNIQEIGWRKMAAAGLREFFTFGAFGDESGHRPDLPPLALQRAGGSHNPSDSYVIGDTPLDIDCGVACRMKTVAVATGRFSLADLSACQPTFACSNLVEFADWLLS